LQEPAGRSSPRDPSNNVARGECDRIDGHVEESKSGEVFQLHPDGHLSHGRRAKDDDERDEDVLWSGE
jgi:hypothetical protein